jgi:hypothetical protein
MSSKIGKGEWVLLYVVTGIIDIAQFLIGFFGAWLSAFAVGLILIAINEAADPFIGGALVVYFQLRGVSLIKHPSRLLSLIGVAGLEEVTGGIAPAWIVDIWYIHRTVKQEDAEMAAQQAQEIAIQGDARQPMYQNGQRLPVSQSDEPIKPANMDGIRAPGGGLVAN